MRLLRWHWHRFRNWRHLILAGRKVAQGNWHADRASAHQEAADRILWPPPPRGPPDPDGSADGD